MFRAACLIGLSCLLPALPGCLIVVDHDSETHWTHDETVRSRHIGVYLDSIGATTASQLKLDASRVAVVSSVIDGSPADAAGLKAHDIITAVDGDGDANPSRVREAIRTHKSGESLSLTILRQGQPQTIAVTLK